MLFSASFSGPFLCRFLFIFFHPAFSGAPYRAFSLLTHSTTVLSRFRGLLLFVLKFLQPTGVGVAVVVRFADNDMIEQDKLDQFARC